MERYLIGKIKYQELEEELELQIQAFLKHFTSIPFINGTQHLHIFPPIWKIVLKLCKKYNISAVRMPSFEKPSVLWLNKRFPFLIPFQLFGEMARVTLKNTNIQCPAGAIGMQYSGKISEDVLINILKRIPNKPIEIVMHPGYESTSLREDLPWAYSVFDWDLERKALLSGKVKDCIDQNNIQLIKFSHL